MQRTHQLQIARRHVSTGLSTHQPLKSRALLLRAEDDIGQTGRVSSMRSPKTITYRTYRDDGVQLFWTVPKDD
jgi:hypothetical protein